MNAGPWRLRLFQHLSTVPRNLQSYKASRLRRLLVLAMGVHPWPVIANHMRGRATVSRLGASVKP
jgi:hypothetical protein